MNLGTATVIRGNARCLPLADNSVDLVVTSPPYFALRSYQDGCSTCHGSPDSYRVKTCSGCGETTGRMKCHNGCDAPMRYTRPDSSPDLVCPDCNGTGKGHYAGQIGDEPTPAEFVDALIEVTAECMRVLKPTGSLWINLGDKYVADNRGSGVDVKRGDAKHAPRGPAGFVTGGMRQKSLMGLPWRYALRCIDDLGLILRAEIIWSKPNGLPESVTDRVRRSHETWLHFTLEPRYFSAVDEIREPHIYPGDTRHLRSSGYDKGMTASINSPLNPLGKLPGSVWTVPTEPLQVPEHLGVDHFAAFPTEWPRRIILGWSPSGVCTGCGQGRRPVGVSTITADRGGRQFNPASGNIGVLGKEREFRLTGYACDCPEPTIPVEVTEFDYELGETVTRVVDRPDPTWVNAAPTTPAVILDPFGGTGTTALVAKALGRHGISVDMSLDYGRLARWRTNDLDQLAKVQGIRRSDQARLADGLDMDTLFDFDGGAA